MALKNIFIGALMVLMVTMLPLTSASSTINISELSREEKIGQMLMVRATPGNEEAYAALHIGGIFLDREESKGAYRRLINTYENASERNLFIATDMEGYWNPFPFYRSKSAGEIATADEAYVLGQEHGELLSEMGFNFNFAPVVEVRNNVWPGRSFNGTPYDVRTKITQYIQGLQGAGVRATAKHYPGGSLVRDPHRWKVRATITEEDLSYFDATIAANVSAIMVGHAIVAGALDSRGRQSTISPEIIASLRNNFHGLIITDAVEMLGLRLSYLFTPSQLFVDLVKAGHDLILDTSKKSSPKTMEKRILAIKKAVMRGEIAEERIDASVMRILRMKGYDVVA